MTISFDTAVIELDCVPCGGTGESRRLGADPDWCEACGGAGSHGVYLGIVLSNLAIGAALCESFALGLYNEESQHVALSVSWMPGCGRTAP